MKELISVLIILSVALFALALGYLVYETLHSGANQRYITVYKNYRKGGRKKHKCPSGCVRGICEYGEYCRNHYPPHPKCCAFDFQCQGCRDPETDKVYLPGEDLGRVGYIDANYYTAKTPEEVRELNMEIRKQNEYVRMLNKRIRRQNERVLETQY